MPRERHSLGARRRLSGWLIKMRSTSRPGIFPAKSSKPPASPRTPTKTAKIDPSGGAYAPASRLLAVRAMLATAGGASAYDVAERFSVSLPTARRYFAALEAAGEPLYEDVVDRRRVVRLSPSARTETLRVSTQQLVTLCLGRRVFDFLEGTGFKEDLDELFATIEAVLKKHDFATAKHLGKKLYDVNEAPHRYAGRVEDVDAVVTALLREEKLDVTYATPGKERTRFVLHPYTLAVYKKGLYLIGYSERSAAIRTYALGAVRKVERRKGDVFVYPAGYDPAKHLGGAFGIFSGGKPCQVIVRFSARVAPYVVRRRWHPTQRVLKRDDGGVELRFRVTGLEEVRSWVLGFGAQAEVLEPASLRAEIASEALAMARTYANRA